MNDKIKLSGPKHIQTIGNYAYITSFGSDCLEIVDISNPLVPLHIGRFNKYEYMSDKANEHMYTKKEIKEQKREIVEFKRKIIDETRKF